MEKITFKDVRKKYKSISGDTRIIHSETLVNKLHSFNPVLENGNYVMYVDDLSKLDDMVDIIRFDYLLKDEKSPLIRFELLKENFLNTYQSKFPKTISAYERFVKLSIDNKQIVKLEYGSSMFTTLKIFCEYFDKEIFDCNNEELISFLRLKTIGDKDIQNFVSFFSFIKNNYDCDFDADFTLFKASSMKTSEDYYTPVEWVDMMNNLFDVDRHIQNAYNNATYSRCWLYLMLHFSIVWRKSDVLNISSLADIEEIDKYDLHYFESNVFTLSEAQSLINKIKMIAEQEYTLKTNVTKHFNIPRIALISTAIAFIITEQWRRKIGKDKLFCDFKADTDTINRYFSEIKFSSLKANRSLLSFFNNHASEINALSGESMYLTSYLRSHKVDVCGNSDTTSIYLHSTYDEQESLGISKQIIDRGAFGWLYQSLLSLSNNDNAIFKDNTNTILNLRNSISTVDIEKIAGFLENIHYEKEEVLNEIYSYKTSDIKEILRNLSNGKLTSKIDDVYCIHKDKCKSISMDCLACKYSIKTTYSLIMINSEILDLINELHNTPEQYVIDRTRLSYQIVKLITIVKDGINQFGKDYVNAFIQIDEINDKLENEFSKLIFLN